MPTLKIIFLPQESAESNGPVSVPTEFQELKGARSEIKQTFIKINWNMKMRRPALRFPEKLMNALDSGKYFDCIRWTADGLAFEIVDRVGVEKKLLKEVFNGTKLQSFIRKVYKWGFVIRSTYKCDAWKIFSHAAFQRGQYQLRRQMKRDMKIGKYSQQRQTSSPVYNNFYGMVI